MLGYRVRDMSLINQTDLKRYTKDMKDDFKINGGLSERNQNFIVLLFVVALLIFGPIEPYGLTIRIAYLIILPVVLWLTLRHWASNWKIDTSSNDRINRALAGGIAGILLLGAITSYTAIYHAECDQYSGGREPECVGDYITVKGGDKAGALIQLVFAGVAFWYAVSKKPEEEL